MKKIFHFAFLAMVAVAEFTSCTDDYSYDPAAKDATSSQAFLNTADGATSYTYLPDMDQKLTIMVGRPDSTLAATIALSSNNSKFNVPSTVSFAAGEGTKDVDVTFDIVTGTSEDVCIAVAPENAYKYGVDSLKLSILRDYTWVKYKDKGLFSNSFFGPENAPIVIAQAKEKPGLYKLYSPFHSVVAEDGLDEAGENNYEILVDPSLKKGGAFATAYSGYTHKTYGKTYHYCQSISQEDNVITMKGYLCIIQDGQLTPAWYDDWTITLPDE